jgi:hypothetical protein
MRLVLGVGMLTILILALTACGGSSGASSSAKEEKANKVHHIPEVPQTYVGKPLPAGLYVTEEFKPAMSCKLEKWWIRGGIEVRDAWDIRNKENDDLWLLFNVAEEVCDPNGSGEVKIAPAPEDMVAWLQENPYLKSEKPKPTSVGGEKGVQFDAIVTDAAEAPECQGCIDLPLFHASNGETAGAYKGEKLRFIVLEDVKGQTVTIWVEASPRPSMSSCPRRRRCSTAWSGVVLRSAHGLFTDVPRRVGQDRYPRGGTPLD